MVKTSGLVKLVGAEARLPCCPMKFESMVKPIFIAGLMLSLVGVAWGQSNLIVNGDFEGAAPAPWVISGQAATVKSNPNFAHNGSGYLSLGGINNQTQFAEQVVTIPSNAVVATLSFYINNFSGLRNGADSFFVAVGDTNGVGSSVKYSETTAEGDQGQGTAFYRLVTVNLLGFAGKSVRVDLGAFLSAASGVTSFFNVDDVGLLLIVPGDFAPNDYFTNRTTITGTVAHVSGNNILASKEPGEPRHGGNDGGRSLWWTWTAPTNGILQLNTSNSSIFTLLGVYTGNSVNALTKQIGANSADGSDFVKVKLGVMGGTAYQIAVDGQDDAGGPVSLNLNFVPDTTRPTVAITSPGSGAKTTNTSIVVQGTASDTVGVALVQVRLENAAGTNDYQEAVGTNHWTATVSGLIPGANTVRARAFDTSSNLSETVSRTFNYIVVLPAVVNISGSGTVSPNYNNTLLELGTSYSMTAKPAAGFIFNGWNGTVSSSSTKLTFTMQSNLVLQATFVPNPFLPVKGNYAGLFSDPNGTQLASAGYFSAMLADSCKFSAKLQFATGLIPVSGSFTGDGNYSNTIPRKTGSALIVQLHVDLSGGDQITGTISDGSWTAELLANRAVFSKTTAAAPEGGKHYTLVIPGADDAAAAPGGFGSGALSVDTAGTINFTGALGDGTKVKQKTFVSKNHTWPFFIPLYAGKGLLSGWLTFVSDDANTDITGEVTWLKAAQSTAKLYPAGFNLTGLEVTGSLYSLTPGAPIFNWTEGNLVLEQGNLAQSITNPVTIGANNKVTGPNKLVLSFTTTSGLFRGSVFNPETGKPIPVTGAVLQKQ